MKRACDNCDEWYHGACVGVSESLSSKIKSFFCHICRNKKPSLTIKYKSKYRDIARILEKNSKFDESNYDSSSVKFYRENKTRLKKEAELLKAMGTSSSSVADSKHHGKKSDCSGSKKSKEESRPTDKSMNPLENSTTKFYGKTNIPSEDIANFFSAITIMNQNLPQPSQPHTTTHMDHDYIGTTFILLLFILNYF